MSIRTFGKNITYLTRKNISTTRAISQNEKSNRPHIVKIIDRERLRNIGIVAHINAGKTTTTERILYHAGSTEIVGDVDRGNTITDYLVQERDRGITITSAAVTFDWKKHRLNLIDTPGHVDFTIEVERSLSVLDGVVTILDASAGVEAQTMTVWNQASKYKLPNVIYLNKYDKLLADYRMCLDELNRDLDIKTILIQIPIKTDKSFSIVDIVNRQHLKWANPEQDNGSRFSSETLVESKLDQRYCELVEEAREKLVNFLSDTDDRLASHVLDCDKIEDVSSDYIKSALRQATINCQLSPVLVGSSFKYIGVQQLLDAVVNYLPSPIDRESQIKKTMRFVSSNTSNSCAFIFKIMHDKRLGPLTYLKVCNGSIKRQQRLKNLKTGKIEQIKKVYRAFADELKEIEQVVTKDDIVVVTGLTEAKTSDILVETNFELNDEVVTDDGSLEVDKSSLPYQLLNKQIIVPQISHMEPVYFCSVESRSGSQQIKMENALACLAREDPSFSYNIDELGITTIKGMGKLHLEIARDRIQSEHGIDSLLGPLQISYRETIEGSATEELSVSRLINGVKSVVDIRMYVRSKPGAGIWTDKLLRLDLSAESTLGKLRSDHKKAIVAGISSALAHGPTLGYPVIDCDVLLLDFKANSRCGLPVISSIASQCLANAMSRCLPTLLEPIMLLEAVVPANCNSVILGDISSRRGVVLSTTAKGNGLIVIRSLTPLATLSNYSEYMRINTSGRGTFSMELNSYKALSEADKQNVTRL